MIVLTEKIRTEIKKAAEKRYFPWQPGLEPTKEQRRDAAVFETGALMFAEFLSEAYVAIFNDVHLRLGRLEDKVHKLPENWEIR